MKKNISKRLIYILLALVPFLFSNDTPDQRYFEIAKNMEIFASVYNEINRSYVDDINPNDLMKVGIDAMLKSLDPYTNFYPEEDIEDFQITQTGEYGGIGAIVGVQKKKLVVLMPYLGFPAEKAGLKIGDEIIAVDKKNVEGKTVAEVTPFLKGDAGSQVEVTVKRYGSPVPLTFVLTREKVTIENVPYYGMLSEDIGYFKLTTFTQKAADNCLDAINNLKSKGAKKLVFDLRGNGGGLLDEALKICNIFLPQNTELVSTRGKIKDWNKTYFASRQPSDIKIPMVVLIDESSASASEIVSGVLQDHDRAVLVGNKTFGKGLVQATAKTDHSTFVKVTVAKYYIPSGRCIQALDYSKKDINGKAIKFPDSLLTAYKTSMGRKVLDGNGVYPDVEVVNDTIPDVLTALINDLHIFDYSTQYFFGHTAIADAKKYDFSREYSDFLNWMNKRNFVFEDKGDIALRNFTTTLQEQKINHNLSLPLEQLKKKLDEDKKDDLTEYKRLIIEEIEKEIASRYYLDKGMIESDFDSDKDINKAIEILNNLTQYNKILSGN